MNPLTVLRIRNASIVLAIMVLIPPVYYLLTVLLPSVFVLAGAYAQYVFLIYIIVALVGGVGARRRARKSVPTELAPDQEHYATFASIRQLLNLAVNLALVLIPALAFLVGRIMDAGVDRSNPFAFSAVGLVFLYIMGPLSAYAIIGALASLCWLLPDKVVRAEQYTIANRLPGRRRILAARTLNMALLVLGLIATSFIVLYGFGGMF